jgi:hypothetical protein
MPRTAWVAAKKNRGFNGKYYCGAGEDAALQRWGATFVDASVSKSCAAELHSMVKEKSA